MNQPISIEIVSDAVCPWCWIGKRRLDRAMAALPDIAVERLWRPFMLNPDMPAEGMPRDDYLTAKFGAEKLPRLYEPLKAIGQEEDLPFDFAAIETMPSSLNAHRLTRWAHSAGVQADLVEILFRRYFAEGENIGDDASLLAAADEVGMDMEIVGQLLAGDADVERIRREDALARQIGISGVPTFIIQGKWALVGAQPAEQWAEILTRVAAGEDLAGG
ncbi:DsbA family oxidoreductase [Zavarzinia compransoris]|uniref:DsbA family oxidoreductase n=1 Tax=Zavarzinia marina TaxID=2911065 RepID=UPI001F1CD1A0|nr:DsbA family oxidoreductase [Zavarzinia marina]MCF4165081.1 DsbA family oxidoreductase [Zavarzinia marina]